MDVHVITATHERTSPIGRSRVGGHARKLPEPLHAASSARVQAASGPPALRLLSHVDGLHLPPADSPPIGTAGAGGDADQRGGGPDRRRAHDHGRAPGGDPRDHRGAARQGACRPARGHARRAARGDRRLVPRPRLHRACRRQDRDDAAQAGHHQPGGARRLHARASRASRRRSTSIRGLPRVSR